MRLWIDGQCLQTSSRLRGIGRYVTELVRAIAENHPEIELLMSFNASMPNEALLAREAVREIIDPANLRVWHGAVTGGEAIEGYTPERHLSELAIAHHVNSVAPDVALSASPFEGVGDFAVPLLPERGCVSPIASIFYDAIPFRYKKRYLTHSLLNTYYHRRLNAYSGFAASFCISEFSKRELQSIHPDLDAVNIAAGVARNFGEIAKSASVDHFGLGAFVLYVGALDWRKNVGAIVRAFGHIDRLWPRNGLKLVVAGDAPVLLLSELVESWKKLGLDRNRLVHLAHISDEQLVSLYKQARVLIQPSFMEGFGLTALEAIYCGTLVVAARAGALPEVVGADKLLFDPAEPEELAGLLVRLLRDDTCLAETLLKQLRKQAAQFTWTRSAALAVEQIGMLAQQSVQLDIAGSRKRIAQILTDSEVDREVAARSLALSEPTSLQRRRLLIDATSTVRIDHKSGIQRVVKKICAALADRAPDTAIEQMFISRDDSLGWFAVDGRTLDPPFKVQQRPLAIAGDILLMLDSSWEFHQLHWKDWRACRLRGGEVISCLYDLVPLKMPAMCNPAVPSVFVEWFKSALTWSTGFVCISRAVADELLMLLKAIDYPRSMKIGYWQLGADFVDLAGASSPRPQPLPNCPRLLMVGTLEPRKGHRVALDAFDKLWAEDVDVSLTIVGKAGWGIDHLVERIKHHPEFGRRLVWHESVNDAELSRLYGDCDALIAASFAEGFGLPIVEAAHFGKRVIASDIPVFREISAGAVETHFFQLRNSIELAEAVKELLGTGAKRTTVPAHSAWPTWSESASQLENVVLGENWYRIYEPRTKKPFSSLTSLGLISMGEPLTEADRSHRLELIEGPYSSEGGLNLKIVVTVTNMSSKVWSSVASQGAAVALGYRLYGKDGAAMQYDNPRTHIPFVHCPGETIYLAVKVPSSWKRRGAAFVDIELVQGRVGWFGGALRVAL
ncbi:glycosyltransferase involved in cell wall biosynthesis [Bradyrhizobium sp. USDA 4532]|uniref:glycosyltransferase family 4 protein n=1 Tax=unclassified Bradyrhizobium TaxID=2631580 RepID=UPI0020A18142|nr:MULTISPECIES: glycosyltransferase family 1 protein [unclassified Bradyrhizobium]MCP1831685.1 glycosyltransferase involved in cell wall biosynthesis [Bradyrhizobium sp. USDA 4545]MCP1916522.1 glycosyltransferase involved in cell wall biosynthesis [Bradyrhizobium sp. USDA 4532]